MSQAGAFTSFQLAPDGQSVVYTGVTPDRTTVRISQPARDLDVMLLMIAGVLQQTLAPELSPAEGHSTEAFQVAPGQGGGVVVSLVSHDIRRAFVLPPMLAGQLAEKLALAVRQARLRLV